MTLTAASLAGFPVATLPPASTLHRIHRAGRSPWWFARDDHGRFNPTHARASHGACYLASAPLGAFIEVFRTVMVIDEADLAKRRRSELTLPRALRLADLTSRKALRFNVTTLSSDPDYSAAQAFASAAADAGFDGIRYVARHDHSARLISVALFGPSGTPDPSDPAWPPGTQHVIDDQLQHEAHAEFGYRILPRL